MVATSVWFAGARQVELRHEPRLDLAANEVRVRPVASAISHGTEMLVYRGQVPVSLELELPTLRGSFAFPIKYGYASAGRVVETGASVDTLQVGDAVFVYHPHQTEFVVDAALPIRLPGDLDPMLGVFLANVETAVNIVLDAAPRLGERVVVFGQGVVGLLVTQLLTRTGIDRLTVVDPIPQRRDLALRVGATEAVDPRELRAGQDFDVAIEVSGNVAALNAAVSAVAFGGTVIVASWYGTKSVPLELGGAFHRRRLRLVSSQVSTVDAVLQPRWSHARRLSVARDLLPRLELARLISHRFPVQAAAEAYRLVDEQPDQTVQVIFTYADAR